MQYFPVFWIWKNGVGLSIPDEGNSGRIWEHAVRVRRMMLKITWYIKRVYLEGKAAECITVGRLGNSLTVWSPSASIHFGGIQYSDRNVSFNQILKRPRVFLEIIRLPIFLLPACNSRFLIRLYFLTLLHPIPIQGWRCFEQILQPRIKTWVELCFGILENSWSKCSLSTASEFFTMDSRDSNSAFEPNCELSFDGRIASRGMNRYIKCDIGFFLAMLWVRDWSIAPLFRKTSSDVYIISLIAWRYVSRCLYWVLNFRNFHLWCFKITHWLKLAS